MFRTSLIAITLAALAGAGLPATVGGPGPLSIPAATGAVQTGAAPLPAFSHQYTVRSATWRSSAVADGSEERPETVYHGTGRVEGSLAAGAYHLASLAYYPSSGGAGVITAVFRLTNRWDESLEFTSDPRELHSCVGSDRERLTLRITLRMSPRSRRVVATYRVFDPHLQEHDDRSGHVCSIGVLPAATEGRSELDVSKFLGTRTVILFQGHNQPRIIGSAERSSVTTISWGFAITLERQ